MVFLLVFDSFESFDRFDNFDSFGRFWRNPEIEDGGPRWPPLKNDYVIPTLYDVIKSSCGRQRKQFLIYY